MSLSKHSTRKKIPSLEKFIQARIFRSGNKYYAMEWNGQEVDVYEFVDTSPFTVKVSIHPRQEDVDDLKSFSWPTIVTSVITHMTGTGDLYTLVLSGPNAETVLNSFRDFLLDVGTDFFVASYEQPSEISPQPSEEPVTKPAAVTPQTVVAKPPEDVVPTTVPEVIPLAPQMAKTGQSSPLAVTVTLQKNDGSVGDITFDVGREVPEPNFMGMKFRTDSIENVKGSTVVSSDKYTAKFDFKVGEDVKAHTIAKKPKYLSHYSDFKCVGIKGSSMQITTPVLPPPSNAQIVSPVFPKTVAKPPTPAKTPTAIETKYALYKSKAETELFQVHDIDSMDYPDHTMIFGTVMAVTRRLRDLGAGVFEITVPSGVPDPTTKKDISHIEASDISRLSKKISIAIMGENDLHDKDVLYLVGPTRLDVTRLWKALEILGNDVRIRVNGREDSVVVLEWDQMAVAISPASFLRTKV